MKNTLYSNPIELEKQLAFLQSVLEEELLVFPHEERNLIPQIRMYRSQIRAYLFLHKNKKANSKIEWLAYNAFQNAQDFLSKIDLSDYKETDIK